MECPHHSPTKRLHSKELLHDPKGPGVPIVLQHTSSCEAPRITSPPKIFKVEKSSVLSRVKTFLPHLERAELELKQRLQTEPQESVDIENVTEDQYIQMDLALVELPELSQNSDREAESLTEDSSSDEEQDLIQQTLALAKRKRKQTQIEEIGDKT